MNAAVECVPLSSLTSACNACPACPQSHLSRSPLNPDMAADQRGVVGGATRLLQAMVDVISSSGWLNPALAGALGDGLGGSSGRKSCMACSCTLHAWSGAAAQASDCCSLRCCPLLSPLQPWR